MGYAVMDAARDTALLSRATCQALRCWRAQPTRGDRKAQYSRAVSLARREASETVGRSLSRGEVDMRSYKGN